MLRIRSGTEWFEGEPHLFFEVEFENDQLHARYCEGKSSTLDVKTTKGQTITLNNSRSTASEMRRLFYDYTNMSIDQCKKSLAEARGKTAAVFHTLRHNVVTIKGTSPGEVMYYCTDCGEVIEYYLSTPK